MMRALLLLAVAATTMTGPVPVDQVFKVPSAGEAVAVIHASCDPDCIAVHEAGSLKLTHGIR